MSSIVPAPTNTTDPGRSPFDGIRRQREDGTEYWSARELMKPLNYRQWRRFEETIDRAKAACRNSGQDPELHFCRRRQNTSNVSVGAPGIDYELSRYACYLVAMNGDPRKAEVAAAQTYFAVQTRRAETGEACRPLPWSQRLDSLVLDFRREVQQRHPDGWAVAVELMTDLLVMEDELIRHGLPLHVSDLPDGSAGGTWSNFRRHQPWALEPWHDCRLVTPHRNRDGTPKVVFPAVYRVTELPRFRRWFHECYAPESFPGYVTRKYKKEVGPCAALPAASAADHACLRLTQHRANLPSLARYRLAQQEGRIRMSDVPALMGPQQQDLFAS